MPHCLGFVKGMTSGFFEHRI